LVKPWLREVSPEKILSLGFNRLIYANTQVMQQFKPITDEIVGIASPVENRVLAQHYGFTAEELDFIINYDIKYCMGRDNGGDD
jgi:hypothetical protein